MINLDEAKVAAWVAIADILGRTYFRAHFEGSCHSYPDPNNEKNDLINYDYFIGFESDSNTGLWTVFARVSVNRETKKVTVLDYKLPDGTRMKNPVKPIRDA